MNGSAYWNVYRSLSLYGSMYGSAYGNAYRSLTVYGSVYRSLSVYGSVSERFSVSRTESVSVVIVFHLREQKQIPGQVLEVTNILSLDDFRLPSSLAVG